MKFTIVTAVYNNYAQIADAVKSVVSQDYSEIEYIIVDGGSTDGTLENIEKTLLESGSEMDIKIISEKDNGIYDAINKGIRAASGDVIGILHSDDIYSDFNVLSRIAAIFKDTNADAVYSDLQYVDKNKLNKIYRNWRAGEFKNLFFGWMPPHPTLFVKKNIYVRYGLFNTLYKIAADYDFILRIFSDKTFKIGYLPEFTVKMRMGGKSNRSISNIFLKSREDYSALKKNSLRFPLLTLFFKNVIKIPQFFIR